jgi:hypothetical protein
MEVLGVNLDSPKDSTKEMFSAGLSRVSSITGSPLIIGG